MALKVTYFRDGSGLMRLDPELKGKVELLDIEIKHLGYVDEDSKNILSSDSSVIVTTSKKEGVVYVNLGDYPITLALPSGYESDDFGSSVAINSNAGIIAVGSPSTNQVFIYQMTIRGHSYIGELVAILTNDGCHVWPLEKSIDCNEFGKTLAMSANGETLIVANNHLGLVNVIDIKYNEDGELIFSDVTLCIGLASPDLTYGDVNISINETGDNFIINKVGGEDIREFTKSSYMDNGARRYSWINVSKGTLWPDSIEVIRNSKSNVTVVSYEDGSITITRECEDKSVLYNIDRKSFELLDGQFIMAISGDGSRLFVSSEMNRDVYICRITETAELKILGKVQLEEGYGCTSLSTNEYGTEVLVGSTNPSDNDLFEPLYTIGMFKI